MYNSLSKKQKEVFDLYKSNSPFQNEDFFADYLNQNLREGNQLGTSWEDKARILDEIIQLSIYKNDIVLYRATFDDFVSNFIQSNNEIHYPAYMSTATDLPSVERHFASTNKNRVPTLLEITCPKGTNMISMEGNLAHGEFEREILLGRGAVFEIIDKRNINNRAEINEIMGGFYGKDYNDLIIYNLLFKEYTND